MFATGLDIKRSVCAPEQIWLVSEMFTTGLGFTLKETSTVSPMQPLALGVILMLAFKSDYILFTGVKTGISETQIYWKDL